MKKNELIEVLNSWNFWKKSKDTGIARKEYIERMRKLSNTGQIVSIIGTRRSGKSTLMLQYIADLLNRGVRAKNTLYVNFEDPRFPEEIPLKLLQDIYESYLEYLEPDEKPFIFLDEVQNVNSWERFVRALHERKEATIFVSGSNSKLLSIEFGSVLTGRYLQLIVYPLSFVEFLYFKNVEIKDKLDFVNQKIKIKRLLTEYLEFGGFPKVVLNNKEKKEILIGYFNDIINRDVVERYKIKNIDKLKTLAKYYFTNISNLMSFNRIKDFLKIPLYTIERFSYNLSYTYLIFLVKKFSYSLKEQEVNPRKVYSIDTGLRNAICFRFSGDLGKLYENVVFLELLRRGKEIYYWRNKRECDFLVKSGRETKAIQVCFEIDNPETKKREINAMIEIMGKFNLKKGLIITGEEEGVEKIKNKYIEYQPLWKWLLNR